MLAFHASIGRVANLTLRQVGGEGDWYAVDITQGRLDLEGCDISSQSSACVAIRDGADPRLRRNQIHDGKQGRRLSSMTAAWARWRTTTSPATAYSAWRSRPAATRPCAATRSTTTRRAASTSHEGGLGTLEDNDITGNAYSGVAIGTGANPTLRRNKIHDNKQAGVFVHGSGLGTVEDNDITGNARAGVQIKTGGDPTLRRNEIHDNKLSGVFVYDDGLGTLEDNDIIGNALSGMEITTGGSPTVRANRINRNGHQAVRIYRGRPRRDRGQRPHGQHRRRMGHRGKLQGEHNPRPQQGMMPPVIEASNQRRSSSRAC